MNKMQILTKAQLTNQFFQQNSGSKRKIPSVVVSGVIMFALSLYYSWVFSDSLGGGDVLPAMVSVMGTAVVFFTGITVSQGMLFGFRDYNTLMALPVTERDIVTSKIVVYSIMQYMYASLLVLPAMIIYGVRTGADAFYFVRAVLGFLPFPLIPMVLAAVGGMIMESLTAGKRYGRLLQNAMTILMIAVIYYFSFQFGYSSAAQEAGTGLAGMLKFLPSARWYVEGTVDGILSSHLLNAGIGLLMLSAFVLFYSKTVIRINARSMQGYHVADFRIRKTGVASSLGALIRQERQRYFANFSYFLNTSISMLLLTGFSFYVIFLKNPLKDAIVLLIQEMPDETALIWQTISLSILTAGQMTCTTGVSISLEGKSLWILKSIPADVKEIFTAKILINLVLILVPSLLSLIGFGIAFRFPLLYYLSGLVLITAGALFISMLGLLFNLRFPKLDYDREAVVIKQSLSAFLSVLVPLFFSIGMMIFYFLTGMTYFWWIIGIYAVLDVILFVLLAKYGTERFRKLA